MPKPLISADDCTGCGTCVDACPNGVLVLEGDIAVVNSEEDCTACGICLEECPIGAITEVEEEE